MNFLTIDSRSDGAIALASTFESGNGFRFRRLANGRYALDIEPEPGDHLFSGSGYYFCFAVRNKDDKPRNVTFEVTAAIGNREAADKEIMAWLANHPDEVHLKSYAGRTKFVIVRQGDEWSHVPQWNILKGRDSHSIAFTCELPPASDANPVLYFSNYHWCPPSEMSEYLQAMAGKHQQLDLRSLCKSIQGRDVWVAEIGNPNKHVPTVVCAATPQPNEMGALACRAILDFLLSGTQEASGILSRHRVCLVPHTNPDGAALGYTASDAAGKFVYFMGQHTIQGHHDAPVEQVALWKYLRKRHPWLFIEWHSNHWDERKAHALLRYDPDLTANATIRRIWDAWDRRLDAMPDAVNEIDETHARTNLTRGYTKSLGLAVAMELGGIPAMIKVHDKYPLCVTLEFVKACFCAAMESFAEYVTSDENPIPS
ncbi:MAG: hypothetical protein KKG09_10015 [Verrucomicrobia bacterium]|nr:hypothetical protein [Verrucomicrobiota bacterium]MBU4291035.1 hypothetical protein [Verrucomicrobiota bacterium]MBU4429347.1 hypothetical protein [Verrucomicrobiota bacterium]MBU4498326.1 hypothetical protein [Verrucomicrobiota bacterium]MCG2679431.1 hypothetical protein [Kiritimatiellia bacterium]